jgi:DNA uptake protein ComE-like DNA-binding protein
LAKRDQRLQYRQLVSRDPALAASMRVGRPDLGREYDDGGLVDVNSIPAEGLQRFAGLSPDEAAEVVRARKQLGRFGSLDELEAFANLSQSTLTRLREVAIFV